VGKRIRALYSEKGIPAKDRPKGKGIHTHKFHDVATSIKQKNPGWSMRRAYATAMATLGSSRAVKAAHRRYKKAVKKGAAK